MNDEICPGDAMAITTGESGPWCFVECANASSCVLLLMAHAGRYPASTTDELLRWSADEKPTVQWGQSSCKDFAQRPSEARPGITDLPVSTHLGLDALVGL